MLETIRKVMRQEKGFTLIELLVVIAIIGILAAIAIPQFAAYKRSAQDGAVQSALRNLAVSMEAMYVASTTYAADSLGAVPSTALAGNLNTTYGYVPTLTTTGVDVITLPAAVAGGCGAALTATCWSATGTNAVDGSGTVYSWDSTLGGAQW